MKTYLHNRLQQDFVKYCILCSDDPNTTLLASKLQQTISTEAIEQAFETTFGSLCEQYFSLDLLKKEGEFSNELPEQLNREVAAQLIADYQAKIEAFDKEAFILTQMDRLQLTIEELCWAHGLTPMPEALREGQARLLQTVKDYQALTVTSTDDDELAKREEAARKISWLERLQANNLDDVMDYRAALIHHAENACKAMLNKLIADLYERMAHHEIFDRLVQHFAAQLAQAQQAAATEQTVPEAWTAAYDQLMPIDFFHRHVRTISDKQAFQMALLFAAARNEQWLIEQGYLRNGELMLFTAPHPAWDYLLQQMAE